jgi:hypothetical protein
LDSDLNADSNAHSVRHTNNNGNANRDCHGNSNGYCNGHADSDRYPNAYPMHGEMYANAAASPHSVTAPITFKFVQSVADTNRPFQFQKRRQDFVRAHNETLSVVAMCVHNPNRSPFAIQR